MDIKKEYGNYLLSQLSSHIFWNCNIANLDYHKDKKIIIERIVEYGVEKDEIVMWKLYSYRTIKKIVTKMDNLDQNKIGYLSMIFNIKESKFKCYKKKPWHLNYSAF